MAQGRVIKADPEGPSTGPMAFNFEDLTDQATRYLAESKQQAERILEQAAEQAEEIRNEAHHNGYHEGLKKGAEEIEQKIETRARKIAEEQVVPSLQKAIGQLADQRAAWLQAWEARAIGLSIAIAERLVRRTVAADASVTRELVVEVLELVVGATEVTLRMNPEDLQALGTTVDKLFENTGRTAPIHVVADEQLEPGDCTVQTRDGTIDGRLETRLQRIEQELLG